MYLINFVVSLYFGFLSANFMKFDCKLLLFKRKETDEKKVSFFKNFISNFSVVSAIYHWNIRNNMHKYMKNLQSIFSFLIYRLRKNLDFIFQFLGFLQMVLLKNVLGKCNKMFDFIRWNIINQKRTFFFNFCTPFYLKYVMHLIILT